MDVLLVAKVGAERAATGDATANTPMHVCTFFQQDTTLNPNLASTTPDSSSCYTPLQMCKWGGTQPAQIFLDANANPKLVGTEGKTAFEHLADHPDLIALLHPPSSVSFTIWQTNLNQKFESPTD